MAEVLKGRGLEKGKVSLGDALGTVIKGLGMPRRLEEVGIGSESFEQIARASLTDWCCQTNPILLTEVEQVMEILEMAK